MDIHSWPTYLIYICPNFRSFFYDLSPNTIRQNENDTDTTGYGANDSNSAGHSENNTVTTGYGAYNTNTIGHGANNTFTRGQGASNNLTTGHRVKILLLQDVV